MADKKTLQIKIRDTQKVIFEGEVDRINSFNEIGQFDIYPMHANFISIIKDKLTLFLKKEKVKELTFEQAVMKVKKDIAHVYLGIEILFVEDVDTSNEKNPSENP